MRNVHLLIMYMITDCNSEKLNVHQTQRIIWLYDWCILSASGDGSGPIPPATESVTVPC